MAPKPAMVLPPVDPASGAVERACADATDVRVPMSFGRYTDDESHVRPVGYYDGQLEPGATGRMVVGPCNPTGAWGSNRHLFDALQSSEGDRYDAEDRLQPKKFRLVLTCVRCGVVQELRGQLDPDDAEPGGDRNVGQVDPVPLQVGSFMAQQIRHSRSWGVEDAEWTVYADGRRVGWMATERGQRGARYVAGGLGRRYLDDHQVAKGPTPITVLRKLARLADTPSPRVTATTSA